MLSSSNDVQRIFFPLSFPEFALFAGNHDLFLSFKVCQHACAGAACVTTDMHTHTYSKLGRKNIIKAKKDMRNRCEGVLVGIEARTTKKLPRDKREGLKLKGKDRKEVTK